MGGYGSGRQYGKPIAEEALFIDIAWMVRTQRAVPGVQSWGNLSWTSRGQPSGNISYTCDMRDPENAWLELKFTVTRRSTGEAQAHTQKIHLSYTEPYYGGKRWWMHCPVNGQRAGKLYVPAGGDIFACRKVWSIGYRSQRVTARDKPFESLFKLQRQLGCETGWEMPIRRPKGMHQRTFAKLEDRYWQIDRQCGQAMAGVLERLR